MGAVLTYSQTTGLITDEAGAHVALGWAGRGPGKNNPDLQAEHELGPLPQGLYAVGPWEPVHTGLGPLVAGLHQIEGESFGRDGFYIHGAALDPHRYGEESKGCIVVPRLGRERIHALNPAQVRVVA